jgi:V8-like Glu-specific endopeptidase
LESLQVPDSPLDRIARAKEAMQRVIKDHFGGDSALAQAVEQLAISGEEAISILDQAEQEPSDNHFSALEAIVAFDGTRPSFLVKQQGIDFSSSYNTGSWSADLQPFLDQLGKVISCVGRVEVGEQHIGTAFLVTPTLAITNRHVAQAIAAIGDGKVTLKPNIFLDFGREQWDAKKSFDRRKVQAIPFVGKDPIVTPISHAKLDLSVLRVAASELGGDLGQRHMTIAHVARGDFGAAGFVTTTGYPGSAELVPNKLKSQYEEVLARLLEGDGGAKRFAPGKPMSTDGINGLADWTILHDATTVGGNSGSPVAMLQNSANPSGIVTVGLHYGGDWGGERSNFAHLLALTGPGVGYGENKTFAEFCTAEGIGL